MNSSNNFQPCIEDHNTYDSDNSGIISDYCDATSNIEEQETEMQTETPQQPLSNQQLKATQKASSTPHANKSSTQSNVNKTPIAESHQHQLE